MFAGISSTNALLSDSVSSSSYSSYISPSPNVSSDLFPAATWPYPQGNNSLTPDPVVTCSATYAPTYTPWQPSDSYGGAVAQSPYSAHTSTLIQPHRFRPQDRSVPSTGGNLGGLGFPIGSELRNMQDYPSPQQSDVSGPTRSSTLTAFQGSMMSPSIPIVASPSIAGSSNSQHSSVRSLQAVREADGLYHCSMPRCIDTPRAFNRKCEWT